MVPERPKGADCKSAGVFLRRFESFPRHHHQDDDQNLSGCSSVGRAPAFQAGGRGFELLRPLHSFQIASSCHFYQSSLPSKYLAYVSVTHFSANDSMRLFEKNEMDGVRTRENARRRAINELDASVSIFEGRPR